MTEFAKVGNGIKFQIRKRYDKNQFEFKVQTES